MTTGLGVVVAGRPTSIRHLASAAIAPAEPAVCPWAAATDARAQASCHAGRLAFKPVAIN